jgi:hypothetical protein
VANPTGLSRIAALALPLLGLAGCFDNPPDTTNIVFADNYPPGVAYQAFAKSKLDAATIDTIEHHDGVASLGYRVPTPGEPGAGEFNFAGGAFTSDRDRDLSRYTAITFWAKASRNVTIDSIGIGNDNTGTSRFQTETNGLPVTTTWTKYTLPIPAPGKLTAERGLFWLAAGAPGSPPAGYELWFDDVEFESPSTAAWSPHPALTPTDRGLDIGATAQVDGTAVTYSIAAADDLKVKVQPATFDWSTSDPAVATVSASGVITATGNGTAVISAKLGGVAVADTVKVTVPAPTLSQMDLPVTFDSPTVKYGLVGFAGAEDSAIVADPAGGTNKVARVNRAASADTYAGTSLSEDGTLGFASAIPFSAMNKSMTVRVYAPKAGIPVRLKVEDHTTAANSVETEATTTMAGAWETLTFNFGAQAAGTAALDLAKHYDKATVFFNFGATGATAGAQTFYFDDVAFVGGGTLAQMDLPVTFDSTSVKYGLLGFGGADDSTIAADPAGGTNQVAKVNRSATAETFAGTTLTADGTSGFATPVPFAVGATKMTVRVYAPKAGIPVRLKVEDHADNSKSVETEASTTVANAWETLTFDFANQASGTAALNLANHYDKATIFFNFGATGAAAGAQTYYFDDVAFGGGSTTLAQMDLPVTFDSPTVAYGLLGFGGADDSTIVADPAGGTNLVGKVVKSATAELWAGTTLTKDGTLGFKTKIPFAAGTTKMTVRVYSPQAGIPVRLKVEDHADATHTCETEALTTTTNTWETLTFDFATQASGTAALNLAFTYDKASIFFNFGTTGATQGARTYYFDDVAFAGGSTGPAQMDLPVTFDSSTVAYGLLGFGGAEDSTIVADPAGGTNLVGKVVKSATAELWAGTTLTKDGTLGFKTKIPFAAGATKMTVRVYSPQAGIPVRLKVEDHADATHSCEAEALTTTTNAWETLTIDFATQASGTAALNLAFTYDKASIFFNFGTTGATQGARTYYFDDVAFGGGSTGPAQMDLPVTFDSPTVAYGLLGFGGAEDSTIVADPAGGTNLVGKVVKSATAELWAGTTLTKDGTLGFKTKIPFAAGATKLTVRVYSPQAGIPVRLKVEDHADATHSCEAEALTTTTNAWETLTIDFATQASGTAALNVAFTYDKASIFFNFGTTGATQGARTYYFDDVAFGGGSTGPAQMDLPVTFDSSTVAYGLLGFGGAEDSTIVADPAGGTNLVGKVVKSATAELWAGTTLTKDGTLGFKTKIPFAAGATKMTVRVYSPQAGIPVRLKVEDHADATHSCEAEALTTTTNAWETLTIDFATQASGTAALNLAFTYDKASIFFNFGTTGATQGARTYYFDDVAFGGGTVTPPPGFTLTFDDAATTYAIAGFGGAEDTSVVTDPTDSTNKVGRVLKSGTAELWAGVTPSTLANNTIPTLPVTATRATITMRVWSPDAGIPVRMKIEDAADPTHSTETEATVTTAAGWQTLSFDFTHQAAGTAALNPAYTFNRLSVFFNFGTTGAVAGAKTYYFDDVTFL